MLKYVHAIPSIKYIISMDPIDDEVEKSCRLKDITCCYIKDLEMNGNDRKFQHRKPSPTDLCTICYSSGTTGLPVYIV
jgi:long-subunit acyl-CoA synthetase (AMP-forming)